MRIRRITEGLPDTSKKIVSLAVTITSIASAISAVVAGYIHIVGRARDEAVHAVQAHELKRITEAHRDTGMLVIDRQELEECKTSIANLRSLISTLQEKRRHR